MYSLEDAEQTMFVPLERMLSRIEAARSESVSALFDELMHTSEMVLKTVVLVTAAAIDDDRDRHRYGHLHAIVRADALGGWLGELDGMVTGPSAQYLTKDFTEIRELREVAGPGTWQHDSARLMYEALVASGESVAKIPFKVDARVWLNLFLTLRNRTKGHGATKSSHCQTVCPLLEDSLNTYIKGFSLFTRQWAYLKRTLSDKYEVVALSSDRAPFAALGTAAGREFRLQDGIYVHIGGPRRVDLLRTNLPDRGMCLEEADFFYPNGRFKKNRYETLSYVTGLKWTADGSEYTTPAGKLAPSHTEGRDELKSIPDGYGSSLPAMPSGYVHRPGLEDELRDLLLESHRHRILTLVGRGGIGKTSLALSVLHELLSNSHSDRYGLCVWFSARDIDLLEDKPVQVRRQVLDELQCAKYFARLVTGQALDKRFDAEAYFKEALEQLPLGMPTLFVFDNFETVKSPVDFFNWIDSYCRHPNKVVITTRHRDFKGDYPIEIGGMEQEEYQELVRETANALGISHRVKNELVMDLFNQTCGHPYVTKIYLGECARTGEFRKPEMIIKDRDDILVALFERSYQALSVLARRVFLTLSNWRSTVPMLAICAVISSSAEEPIDVMAAIEELKRASLVEEIRPSADSVGEEEASLRLPLEAALFGQKKLQVDPLKLRIELDTKKLQMFGAADVTAARQGVEARVLRLFRNIVKEVEGDPSKLASYGPLISDMGRRYPDTWRMAAELYLEVGGENGRPMAISALMSLIETEPDPSVQVEAWRRIARLSRSEGDIQGELNAWTQIIAVPTAQLCDISEAANSLNFLYYYHRHDLDKEILGLACERAIYALSPFVDADATADDLSRLAWMYVNTGELEKAKSVIVLGLQEDPLNTHLLNLKNRLGIDFEA